MVRRIQSVLENEEFWLQNDKNILTTKDAWLNDRIMDAAQKLICKALGKIGSFQSLLNSQKNQITHSGQVATSTYSCYMTETTIGFFLFVPVAVFRFVTEKPHWSVYAEEFKFTVSKLQRYDEWKTDIVISACSKTRRRLQLRRICHCICRRDSRWKISH